ncbi:MAG: hypothetical protein R2758_04105 [Bacteroidales bacterium]
MADRRSYRLLTEEGSRLPPEDIFIDPNILAKIATGIEEHNNYAVVI